MSTASEKCDAMAACDVSEEAAKMALFILLSMAGRKIKAIKELAEDILQATRALADLPRDRGRPGAWAALFIARALGDTCAVWSNHRGKYVSKAYWVTTYREIKDPAKMAAYAAIAGPVIVAAGGRFLARGMPSQVYESGMMQRVVVVEFDSVQHAVAAHDSTAYQEALAVLGDGADREIRIVEGLA